MGNVDSGASIEKITDSSWHFRSRPQSLSWRVRIDRLLKFIFGIAPAVGLFSQVMRKILHDLKDFGIRSYFDDLIVSLPSAENPEAAESHYVRKMTIPGLKNWSSGMVTSKVGSLKS